MPRPLHEKIRTSRYYTKDTDSITITSERTRRAKEKKDDCFRKQLTMLKYIGKEAVPGESKGLDPGTPVSELFVPRIVLWIVSDSNNCSQRTKDTATGAAAKNVQAWIDRS